jgi:hypothetical protein
MTGSDPFEIYRTHEWFESLAWQHRWIEFMVGWWCGTYGVPDTMIDYGSGDGWWPHSFKSIGAKHCYAVELDKIAFEHTPPDVFFVQHDLREELTDLTGRRFDLVLCLEVAEHLPKHQAHNALIATLVKSTGNNLIFSAAQPGQEGTGHINLQPFSYWIETIERWSYIKLNGQKTADTRKAFERFLPDGFRFLANNLLVFSRV